MDRLERWLRGVIVSRGQYDCTFPRCKQQHDELRLNQDGVWCLQHYLGAPSCAKHRHRPAIPLVYTNGVPMCRDCWQDSFGVQTLPSPEGLLSRVAKISEKKIYYSRMEPPTVEIESLPAHRGCYLNDRGLIVHVFPPGQLRCECGKKSLYKSRNRHTNRKDRKPRPETPSAT